MDKEDVMIYKVPKSKPIVAKRNKQAKKIQKAVKEKTYTVDEVAEIIRLAQEQGGKTDGR